MNENFYLVTTLRYIGMEETMEYGDHRYVGIVACTCMVVYGVCMVYVYC